MPIKLSLKFKSYEPVSISSLNPKTIHGIFFSLFTKEDGELFHAPTVKPFSLFYLPWFRKVNKDLNTFSTELNILDNELFPIISRNFFTNREKQIFANEIPISINSIKPIEISTYQNLLESSQNRKDLILDFITPTSFKKGRFDYILPDTVLIFKSLLNKWNVFSPIKLDKDFLKWVKENILISGCWITTKKLQIANKIKITGFTGRVYFYIAGNNTQYIKLANTLAKFAEFAGVGRKTTMGFGKVKLAKNSEEA